MENSAEALKMGFAVLVFVSALTIALALFSKARQTAQIVLSASDKTIFYDYMGTENENEQARIVGTETILPTLYKYYKEGYSVVFRNLKGGVNYITQNINIQTETNPLYIYKSTIDSRYWNSSYTNEEHAKYGNNGEFICEIDLEDEVKRNEPWTQGVSNKFVQIKTHLDCLISGKVYTLTSNANKKIDYSGASSSYNGATQYGGFLSRYKNKKFLEIIGREDKEEQDTSDTIVSSLKSKRIIYYVLVD